MPDGRALESRVIGQDLQMDITPARFAAMRTQQVIVSGTCRNGVDWHLQVIPESNQHFSVIHGNPCVQTGAICIKGSVELL